MPYRGIWWWLVFTLATTQPHCTNLRLPSHLIKYLHFRYLHMIYNAYLLSPYRIPRCPDLSFTKSLIAQKISSSLVVRNYQTTTLLVDTMNSVVATYDLEVSSTRASSQMSIASSHDVLLREPHSWYRVVRLEFVGSSKRGLIIGTDSCLGPDVGSLSALTYIIPEKIVRKGLVPHVHVAFLS